MLKLIIQAEETNNPDGSRDFGVEVYMDPNKREAHVTDLELMTLTSLRVQQIGQHRLAQSRWCRHP